MITPQEEVVRLVVAALLGALVGFERERLDRAAGMRTHGLVCVGAALFMMVSAFGFEDVVGRPGVDLDPSRVAAGVVSGVGFLGAGMIILQRQEVVRGLTTAASVWAVAAVGLAVGGGMYLAATAAVILMLGILAGLQPDKHRLAARNRPRTLLLDVSREAASLDAIERALEAVGVRVERLVFTPDADPARDRLELVLRAGAPGETRAAADAIRGLPGVRELSVGVADG